MHQRQFQEIMNNIMNARPDELHPAELSLIIATLVNVFEQEEVWESISKAVEEMIHVQLKMDVEGAAEDAKNFLDRIVNGMSK